MAESRWTTFGLRQRGLEQQTLVDETMAVIDALGIERFNLLTLSYGSIPGSKLASQYKDRIDNLILAAPAVMSSHRYNAYGISRHAFYSALPKTEFWQHAYDAELYSTMLPMIASQGKPDGVSFMDFFHGVYQMARSAKWFDLKDIAEQDLPPTHLFLASREDPPLYWDQIRFWELMESNASKGTMVLFEGAPHAITGVVPKKSAEMTAKIIRNKVSDKTVTVAVKEKDVTASSTSDSKAVNVCASLITESSTK